MPAARANANAGWPERPRVWADGERDFDTSQYYRSLALVITRPTMPYAIASSVLIQ
jgi:hypothetical protein